MNKRHYEHTLPNIRGSLSNTYESSNHLKTADGTGTDTNADTGKKKVPYPGTDRQIPSTGKGRTRTHLHTAGPDTGDKQSS